MNWVLFRRLPRTGEAYSRLEHTLSRLEALPMSQIEDQACHDEYCRIMARGQTLESCLRSMTPDSSRFSRRTRRAIVREVQNFLEVSATFLDGFDEQTEGFGAFLLNSFERGKRSL